MISLRRHNWQSSPGRALPSEGSLQIPSRGHGRTPVWSRRSHRRSGVWRSRRTGISGRSHLETGVDGVLVAGRGLVDGGALLDRAKGTFPSQLHATHLILDAWSQLAPKTLRVAPNPSPSLKPLCCDRGQVERSWSSSLQLALKQINQMCSKVKAQWTKFASNNSTIQTEKTMKWKITFNWQFEICKYE